MKRFVKTQKVLRKAYDVLALIVLASAVVLSACSEERTERSTSRGATGRGNGGNTKVSASLVKTSMDNLKVPLRKCFEGLRAIALAEATLPGSTSINKDKELLELILVMTKDSELDLEDGDYESEESQKEPPSVFDDIDTKENFVLSESGCFDYRGEENTAGTELLGIGKPICFSLPLLINQTLEGGETAFQIGLLGLAVHELVHHFYDGGTHEKSEAMANKLQDFLIRDLNRASVLSSDSVISIDEFDFVDQFVKESKDIQESVKTVPPAIEIESEIETETESEVEEKK